MTSAETTSSPVPTSGSVQPWRKALAKNSTAQTSAITTRMSFAGSTALTSRYFRPVKPSTSGWDWTASP